MGFVTALWHTLNQPADTPGPLTLMRDWEQSLEDMIFIDNCPEITSSGLLPLKSTKKLVKVSGDTIWKVWASYHLTHEENTGQETIKLKLLVSELVTEISPISLLDASVKSHCLVTIPNLEKEDCLCYSKMQISLTRLTSTARSLLEMAIKHFPRTSFSFPCHEWISVESDAALSVKWKLAGNSSPYIKLTH